MNIFKKTIIDITGLYGVIEWEDRDFFLKKGIHLYRRDVDRDNRVIEDDEFGKLVKISESKDIFSNNIMTVYADKWFSNKKKLEDFFKNNTIDRGDYNKIVEALFRIILEQKNAKAYDIDHNFSGGMQTFWFVNFKNPDRYTCTIQENISVITYCDYGTCSECDALEAAIGYEDKELRAQALLNISLNMFQHAKFLYLSEDDISLKSLSSLYEKEEYIERTA